MLQNTEMNTEYVFGNQNMTDLSKRKPASTMITCDSYSAQASNKTPASSGVPRGEVCGVQTLLRNSKVLTKLSRISFCSSLHSHTVVIY
jgi:hypothetical protein